MEGQRDSSGADGRDPRRGRRPGPGFAAASHDEAAGMLCAAAAAESRAAAAKLAAVRELIRWHAPALPGGALPGPASWDVGLPHEVAALLRVSWQAAAPLVELAWQLEARLPGVGELLEGGVLSPLAVKIIAEELSVLDGDPLAEALRRLLARDLGADDMTPGRIRKLCQRLADTVDPDGAARRREAKERDEARVAFYRAHGGAAAMHATGLPTDEALKSRANIQKRALEYKAAGIGEKMDLLRVLALVDLVNGVTVPARRALWQAGQAEKAESAGQADQTGRAGQAGETGRGSRAERAGQAGKRRAGGDDPDHENDGPGGGDGPGGDGGGSVDGGESDGGGPGDGNGGPGGPGGGPGGGGGSSGGDGPGGAGQGPAPAGMPDPGLPTLANMTFPLATVLGQAERPGEAAGYGSLDPALARRLAGAAAASPRSEFCVTFTDSDGHAAAHGCARLIREPGNGARDGQPGGTRDGPPGTGPPPGTTGWAFARDTARPGPEGGYGTWTLTVPGNPRPETPRPGDRAAGDGQPGGPQPEGRRYRVEMHKVPLRDCDHRHAAGAYRPGGLLRHLVQVRDGECTFPGCSHPAGLCDFEHAVPYDQGGATCACNAGARSRRCHQVKQSKGWKVTQPEPGWHAWTAPSGRTFTKGPKIYPA